jgi:hypothetical protein
MAAPGRGTAGTLGGHGPPSLPGDDTLAGLASPVNWPALESRKKAGRLGTPELMTRGLPPRYGSNGPAPVSSATMDVADSRPPDRRSSGPAVYPRLLQFAMQDIGQLTYLGLPPLVCLPRATHGIRCDDRNRLQSPAGDCAGRGHYWERPGPPRQPDGLQAGWRHGQQGKVPAAPWPTRTGTLVPTWPRAAASGTPLRSAYLYLL